MSSDTDLFEQAASTAKSLPERPENETLLKLYAFYKQGSEGDVNGVKPGFFDFVGVAKYESWEKTPGQPMNAKSLIIYYSNSLSVNEM